MEKSWNSIPKFGWKPCFTPRCKFSDKSLIIRAWFQIFPQLSTPTLTNYLSTPVGSYASLSVCPSICLSICCQWTKIQWHLPIAILGWNQFEISHVTGRRALFNVKLIFVFTSLRQQRVYPSLGTSCSWIPVVCSCMYAFLWKWDPMRTAPFIGVRSGSHLNTLLVTQTLQWIGHACHAPLNRKCVRIRERKYLNRYTPLFDVSLCNVFWDLLPVIYTWFVLFLKDTSDGGNSSMKSVDLCFVSQCYKYYCT